MSSAALSQFLIDITRGPWKGDFAANGERLVNAAPLDEQTKTAIRNQDIGALWLAGAHPLALLYFSRACGWDNERYYRCLSEAEARSCPRDAR
ncbi:MAG: hypothetical protein AB7S98_17475 [Burkholderiaceae bacterium]